MSFNERRQLLEQLDNKDFRDALVEADIGNGILFQLQAMLEEKDWTQEELAERAETSQPVISKYLRGYDKFSLKTLKRLASVFDVSLTVRFEKFSELVTRYLNLNSEDLNIPSFDDDALYKPSETHTSQKGDNVAVTATTDNLPGLVSALGATATVVAAEPVDANLRSVSGTAKPEESAYAAA